MTSTEPTGLRSAGHALFATTLAVELALGFVRFWAVAMPIALVLWARSWEEAEAEAIATWAGALAALALPAAGPLSASAWPSQTRCRSFREPCPGRAGRM